MASSTSMMNPLNPPISVGLSQVRIILDEKGKTTATATAATSAAVTSATDDAGYSKENDQDHDQGTSHVEYARMNVEYEILPTDLMAPE
ncbi:hypothetical protein RvY_04282 [Ramazzottius varieornatus]|uniref:Uncharacterized protein n=1 Tax=Ramazzottius varieornatus TaxID=947166 RepID=A0A1D1UXZ1_RAMVA|nr:hypothetical protein RvY_04282 [Ramazzottius varieornatus]